MRKIDLMLAACTVTAIATILVYLWLQPGELPALVRPTPGWIALALLLFATNLCANVFSRLPTLQQEYSAAQGPVPVSLYVGAVTAIALMLIFVPGICGILWILLVAQLPRYYGWNTCLAAAIIIPLMVGSYHQFVFDRPYSLINTSLHTLFNLFVIYLGFTLESERRAKEQASRLVTELTATQQLLTSTSKRDERLRIARELHDLSGHHLAALSLQLEVARHTEGEKHQHAIERAGFIAHLLLSELRQTVSEFREHRGIDIRDALTELTRHLPRPQVWISLQPDLCLDDVQQAETLLRSAQEALTNVVRHSRADKVMIQVQQHDQQLVFNMEDNGGAQAPAEFGNGLKGMLERVQGCGGELTVSNGDFGFRLDIQLPLGNGLIV